MRNTTITELYLGAALGWVDVTADSRQGVADSGGGHTITRNEGDAGTMDLVLASPAGKYSPRNPRSEYFGLLGRNTPIRFGLIEESFDFGTDVTAGWGTGWTSFGAGGTINATDSAVSGGTAKHSVPLANAYRASYYGARTFRDCEVRFTLDMVISDVVGASIEPANVMLRMQDLNTYYLARVEVTASEVVRVWLLHSTGGTIAGPVTVPGLTFTGQPLEVAASCVADRLAVKVWDPAAGGEPRDWQLTAVDGQLAEAGNVGVRSGVASGNTNSFPLEFRYDNLRVIDRRAVMEVSEWPPRWNPAGTDAWAPLQASGILRRLGQGSQPALSALRRTIDGSGPVAYWPGEDGVLSEQASSARSGVSPLRVSGSVEFKEVADYVSFAGVSTRYGTTALPNLSAGGSLDARLSAAGTAATTAAWTVHAVVLVDATTLSGDLVVLQWTTDGGTYTRWELKVTATSRTQVIGYTPSGAFTLLIDEPSASAAFLHYAVSAEQVGGNVTVTLYRELSAPSTVFGGTIGGVVAVAVNPTGVTSSIDMPAGHIAVWASGTLPLARTAFFDDDGRIVREALRSWQGEGAADRFERLCAEQGVPVFITRGPDPSPQMGPQPPGTFLDLLRECVEVDGGILGEAREHLALTMRCLGALYNQTPVQLDYTHLAPPLEPVDDDDQVRNDVEVKRPEGGSARAVLDEGPLSVLPPPDGVGRYDTSVEVNVATDGQLAHHAGWRLHVGTWDEARFPTARVNLAAPVWAADPGLLAEVVALDAGGVLELGGLPEWLPPGPTRQMVRGSVERVDQHARAIDWTLVPAGPYSVGVADGDQRVAADGSTLALAVDEDDLTLMLASTAENRPWTQDAADMPVDVRLGGERVTVTAITYGANDGFDRTNVDSWGPGYDLFNAVASAFQVPGTGVGTVSPPALTTDVIAARLVGGPDQDVRVRVIGPGTPTGGAITQGLAAAMVDGSNFYRAVLNVTTGGAVSAQLWKRAGGLTLLGSSATSLSAATSIWVRVQCGSGRVRMKVWQNGQPEPGTWTLTATDTSLQGGYAGVLARRESGHTSPLAQTFDNFMIYSPQLVTVSARGVNGVQRAWPAGTEVDVWEPAVVAL